MPADRVEKLRRLLPQPLVPLVGAEEIHDERLGFIFFLGPPSISIVSGELRLLLNLREAFVSLHCKDHTSPPPRCLDPVPVAVVFTKPEPTAA